MWFLCGCCPLPSMFSRIFRGGAAGDATLTVSPRGPGCGWRHGRGDAYAYAEMPCV